MAAASFRVLIGLAGAAALALSGCGKREPEPVAVVTIDSAQPRLVDPANGPLSNAQALAMGAMAQGLVRFDARGEIEPGLAERWNVSDDGMSYIFRLAKEKWADGRKVTARDVARSLNRQIRSGSRNELKDTLGAIAEVVAMTDRVIEIRLTAPRPNLLQILAQPEMGVLKGGVGAGPFMVDKERAARKGIATLIHRQVVIDGPDVVDRAQLDSAGAAKAIDLFVRGERDLVLGGTNADLPLAKAAKLPRGALRFDPVIGLFGLVPARAKGPASDRDVRRLLNRAIDRDALVAAIGVSGLTARATILQAGLDGLPPQLQPAQLGASPADRLRILTDEATRLFGKNERPTIAIRLPEGPGADLLLARLQADWGALGLAVKRAGKGEPADFLLIDAVAPTTSPAWFVRRFRCDEVAVCSPEADELMKSARAATVGVQRAALLAEAARLLDERQAFIALSAPVRWSLAASRLSGFSENKAARHPLIGLTRNLRREGQ
ncbi:MAG: ABC transporter substrate-binding protein [Sphingomicrobium sp.]